MGDGPANDRYKRLPEPVRLEDTVTTSDVRPVPDPYRGRDTERDFVVRHGLGGL